MLLAIDAGNTNVVFALYEGDNCRYVWRRHTDRHASADEYASFLQPLFAAADLKFSHVTGIVMSSVVPDATPNLIRLCDRHFKQEPLVADYDTIDIQVKLARPDHVGGDRLVNAAAVARFYRYPAIIVDFGTATTFDVLDASGAFCGGVITPGPNLSREALFLAAARLPRVNVERPVTVVGKDTIAAMQSGLYWGYASMAEGIISRIRGEIGGNPLVIATGGLSGLFGSDVPSIETFDKDLTLRGLVHIFQDRKKQQKAA